MRASFADDVNLLFETVELYEPPKRAVREFTTPSTIVRTARFNVHKRGETGVWRGRIDLTQGRLLTIDFLAEARPMISPEEFMMVEDAVKANPEFQEALKRRGIENIDLVCVDPWSAGNFGVPGEENKRLAHTFVWVRQFDLYNYYAHPVEGLNMVVDIDRLEVIQVDDHSATSGEDVPMPMIPSNYNADVLTDFRKPLKPLDVAQSEGPSITLDGNKLTWDSWNVRIGFTGREGLVLHYLGYTEISKRRSVAYRLSLAEMVVPYGTTEGIHYRKNVFDSGEYGFGKLVNSLALGCDCLGHIQYLGVVLPDLLGNPRVVPSGICIHEEDAGLAWKHFEFRTERDGAIEFEVKATGIINTVACIEGSEQQYGTEVSPGVVGYNHPHVFCMRMRMDLEMEGPNNTVVECNTIAPTKGPENPMGNAFRVEQTALATELATQRKVDFEKSRYWKIINPGHMNAMGKPAGFKLETPSAIQAYAHPESPSGQRSGFMYNHLWVTPYDPEERFPAGEFVNHSTGDDGLPAWTAENRPT